MAADFTSWEGLVDRTYTGRHLRAAPAGSPLPDIDKVVDLFMREDDGTVGGRQIDSTRSTFMFAAFAQWFTDSFLRTAHAFEYDDEGNVKRDSAGAPLREPGRERKNTSNHEIDLCQIYGLNERQTGILRLKDPADRGCLKYQNGGDGEYPPFLLEHRPDNNRAPLPLKHEFADLHPDERIIRSIFLRADHNDNGYETIFATGLEHSNATIGNALLNTIFLREHNRVARLIASDNPGWDDERVFQTTRNVMIVLLLKIVISDYIRHITPLNLPLEFQPGFAETQSWYRTNRISIEFNLLYRWHSLVPSEFSFMPNPADPSGFRHNNAWLMQTGVGKAVDLFSKQRAGRIGAGNTPRYLRAVKQDTVTLMRAARLASYNDYRARFGLSRAGSFGDVTKDPALNDKLRTLYNDDIDSLEWYAGLFCEDHGEDMIMGKLLMTMVAHDAFTQALTNPLLSTEVFREETFSAAGWRVINGASRLTDIVQRVTNSDHDILCSFTYGSR
jgi:prostaglandin-endoperoxide synthase 2